MSPAHVVVLDLGSPTILAGSVDDHTISLTIYHTPA